MRLTRSDGIFRAALGRRIEGIAPRQRNVADIPLADKAGAWEPTLKIYVTRIRVHPPPAYRKQHTLSIAFKLWR
jgi:hypothetical protein